MLPQSSQTHPLASPGHLDRQVAQGDASAPAIEKLLVELLAELRRQTALLERAQRDHQEEPTVLLSKRDAARRLAISRGRTLDSMIASGQIRAVRMGGRLRIPVVEIERLQHQGSGNRAPARRRDQNERSANAMNDALKRRGF